MSRYKTLLSMTFTKYLFQCVFQNCVNTNLNDLITIYFEIGKII